ncbi:GGDEF domain [Candidatus Nanopelagicaceae bacterium]
MYRAIRLLPVVLLLLHLFLKLFIHGSSLVLDLIVYNAIWIFAIAAITQAPLSNDPIAVATTSLAIGFWGVGSLLNSYADFYPLSNASQFLAQLSYVFFYPLLLVAIPRTLSRGRRLNPIEVLDSVIFGLGISAIATAAFLSKVFPESIFDVQDQFFSLLFPVSDLLLLTLAAIAVITHRLQKRALLLFLGILIFSASDLFYLWLSVNNNYAFGQISDDGWLIGIVAIANSFWHVQRSSTSEITIHPVFIALSIFISPTLLALMALRPGIFSIYILIPTIATLFLAFIRMTIVIRQARNLGEEKVLARTDELTGLPNRRRLVAELATYSHTEGALLLLDLNAFKPVNDQYGHEVGDLILQQVAQRFSRSLPTGAVLARLGGDEFGVLINGSYERTLEAAFALQATLSYPFIIRGHTITIGVSIGHAHNDGENNLLERADAAMYEAKRTGVGITEAR